MNRNEAPTLQRILYQPACFRDTNKLNRYLIKNNHERKFAEAVTSYFNPFKSQQLVDTSDSRNYNMNQFNCQNFYNRPCQFDQARLVGNEIRNHATPSAFNPKPNLTKEVIVISSESQSKEDEDNNSIFSKISCDEQGKHNPIKTVQNIEGKEFEYYENLEEVKQVMSKKHPSMSKQQMYKELLKPYKHRIQKSIDAKTGREKEVYLCGYEG